MVFDLNWFKKHQKGLLFLLNNPILKYWFRWVLRIHKDLSFKERICEIEPNNYKVKISKNKYRADFRTHDKFSKRLYFAFKPFWYLLHYLDLVIFDRYELKFSFGFSTLTVYPDAGTGATTCDGPVYRGVSGDTFTDLRDGIGTTVVPSLTTGGIAGIWSDATLWLYLLRSIFNYDTSSLGTTASISAATMSIYGTNKNDSTNWQTDTNIYETNPAANNNLQNSDYTYTNWGTTPYSTTINFASWNTAGYNDFVMNATGISAINKTGVTNYGVRDVNYDVANSEPVWIASTTGDVEGAYADYTGTTQDPKLVITYTTGTTTTNNIAGLL